MKGITGKLGLLIILTLIILGLGMAAKNSIGKDAAGPQGKVSGEQFTWSFQNAGTEEETGAPMTVVTLRADGAPYEVGTYQGSCAVIEGSGWELQENELSGAICWFAGGGTEIGVFREGGKIIVKTGQLDEGSAEEPGFRGNFKALIEL